MMGFIPIDSYTAIYFHIMLLFMLMMLVHAFILDINDYKNLRFLKVIGYVSLFFVLIYMGFRPIHSVFVDMTMYAYSFARYQENIPLLVTEDYMFYWFLEFSAKIMNVEFFFFVCTLLYVIPIYILSKKWFKDYWFYSFFIMIVSFSFWAYGTNGIRNGIATSLFLFSLLFLNKKTVFIPLIIVSFLFHKTMLLPTIGVFLTLFFNKPKAYLLFWLLTIPVSLILGNFFVEFIADSGFSDNRVDLYFTDNIDEGFSSVGFRWDFLLYSATGVFAGWYFIFKKQFNDSLYTQLFNVYLFSNAFWVLVIRANFSNRFAYLSWFMLGIIIIYPLLKGKLYENQNKVIGLVILAYFSFTYFMNVILAGS